VVVQGCTRPLGAPAASASSPASLATVNDFLYQLQDIDLEAIGATAYDLVVMDYSADGSGDETFTAAEIAALKQFPGGGNQCCRTYLPRLLRNCHQNGGCGAGF
jgi:uncharacterized protein (TIGR01370 family)